MPSSATFAPMAAARLVTSSTWARVWVAMATVKRGPPVELLGQVNDEPGLAGTRRRGDHHGWIAGPGREQRGSQGRVGVVRRRGSSAAGALSRMVSAPSVVSRTQPHSMAL